MQAAGAFWAGAVCVAESTVGTPAKRRLLDRIRDALRTRHNSSRTRTERAYLGWIRRYLLLFWLPYLPYYLWRTRRAPGLVLFVGVLGLFWMPYFVELLYAAR